MQCYCAFNSKYLPPTLPIQRSRRKPLTPWQLVLMYHAILNCIYFDRARVALPHADSAVIWSDRDKVTGIWSDCLVFMTYDILRYRVNQHYHYDYSNCHAFAYICTLVWCVLPLQFLEVLVLMTEGSFFSHVFICNQSNAISSSLVEIGIIILDFHHQLYMSVVQFYLIIANSISILSLN